MIWTEARKELARTSLNKWHGTKHVDRIAVVGVGIDCIQLIKEVLVDAGVIEQFQLCDYDVKAGLFNVSNHLAEGLNQYLDVTKVATLEFGDIVIFRTGRRSGHAGFFADGFIWHSLANLCVTKSKLALWKHEIQSIYRINSLGLK